jgi:hypothetical protein
MWRTHGDDNKPCRIEIERKHHGDLWVFDDAINRRQKIWVGGELVALFHNPQAVANGASSIHSRFASTSGPQTSIIQWRISSRHMQFDCTEGRR